MIAIRVEIVRYVSDAFPGFVEARLVDTAGREWLFHDKVPIFTAAPLDASSNYPQPATIACEIVQRRQHDDGREIVTVDTERPWNVISTRDTYRFDVYSEQLMETE
jgi:hypothetical protein